MCVRQDRNRLTSVLPPHALASVLPSDLVAVDFELMLAPTKIARTLCMPHKVPIFFIWVGTYLKRGAILIVPRVILVHVPAVLLAELIIER